MEAGLLPSSSQLHRDERVSDRYCTYANTTPQPSDALPKGRASLTRLQLDGSAEEQDLPPLSPQSQDLLS